jgi:hypothetical protein
MPLGAARREDRLRYVRLLAACVRKDVELEVGALAVAAQFHDAGFPKNLDLSSV